MIITSLTAIVLASLSAPSNHSKPTMSTAPKANIVLVHGAFANASGWNAVIALLQKDGYNVTAVENPLACCMYEDDINLNKRRELSGRRT